MIRTHRLSSADFRKLRSTKRIAGEFFTLSLSPSPYGAKWACVVSKKVSARAVVRNLIKRRARAVLSKELIGARDPIALVFHAKRDASSATFAQVSGDLKTLLGRAGLRGTPR